jgi:GTP cyclohydrolase I
MQKQIEEILKLIGENPTRDTEAYKFLTSGYNQNLEKIINNAIFDEKGQDMIVQNNIEFYSLCEHHLLPFFGKIHIGYIPENKVIGLSKLPRIVEIFSRRLQIQERLSREIAETIEKTIQPKGVAVVIEAYHFCMMMRGVEKQHSKTITSTMLGLFRNDDKTRNEFLKLIKL